MDRTRTDIGCYYTQCVAPYYEGTRHEHMADVYYMRYYERGELGNCKHHFHHVHPADYHDDDGANYTFEHNPDNCIPCLFDASDRGVGR